VFLLLKNRYPAGLQGYHNPTLMMRRAAEGDLIPPRARPRARGLVFTPSPTMLGPFAPQ
jgi:hypothetical protein